MGRIAAALSDLAIVTSDNPRTESPYAILHDVLEGMRGTLTPFAVIEDRREAIAYALSHARRGDVVVLAGKGHETYQTVGTKNLPLDERQVVCEYLERQA
jgi:UDP-N-acetylmuramoyl-L-alanyl-D-glutamate--2,6-diaminopimelate ligase